MTEKEIIKGCRKRNKAAQKELYDTYVSALRGICQRYATNHYEAKDIVQEGFLKVYSKINQYKGKGSFEGWLKRIFINTAISYYKDQIKNISCDFQNIDERDIENNYANNIEKDHNFEINTKGTEENEINKNTILKTEFSRTELMGVLKTLPVHYRVVFSLYFIDDYKHKEIATQLKIDEKTSRTRLLRARKLLQQKLYDLSVEKLAVKSN